MTYSFVDLAWDLLSNLHFLLPCQAQTGPEKKKKKMVGQLKESMLEGSPFPKLHAKAAETKAMIQPTAAALRHFADQDPAQGPLLWAMVTLLDCSRAIDELVDGVEGFKMSAAEADQLEALVQEFNYGVTRALPGLCQEGPVSFQLCAKKPLPDTPCHAWETLVSQAGLVLSGGGLDEQNQDSWHRGAFAAPPPANLVTRCWGSTLLALSMHCLPPNPLSLQKWIVAGIDSKTCLQSLPNHRAQASRRGACLQGLESLVLKMSFDHVFAAILHLQPSRQNLIFAPTTRRLDVL